MKNEYDFDKIMDEFYKLNEKDKEQLLNPSNFDKYKNYQFSNQFKENMNKILNENLSLEKEKINKKRTNHKNILKISVAAILIIFISSLNRGITYGGLIDIINYWREVFNGDTYITTQKEINNDIEYELIEPSYIPDGYKEIERNKKKITKIINYEDDNGYYIYYKYSTSTNGQIMLNTENAKIENIKVKNNDIMLIYKENNIKAFFYNKKYTCIVSMEYYKNKEKNYTKREIIKIVKSVIN